MKIVVARFIENIDWCYSYKNVVIYNKSSFLYDKSLVSFFCPKRKYIWIKDIKNLKERKENNGVKMISIKDDIIHIENIDFMGDDEFKFPCDNIYEAVRIYGKSLNCKIYPYKKNQFYAYFDITKKKLFLGIKTNKSVFDKLDNIITIFSKNITLENIIIRDKIINKYNCNSFSQAKEIYNNFLNTYSPPKIIEMPNIGREGHTYTNHIIENYNNLDDYTIFLQGYPYDHTPKLNEILNKIFQDEIDFLYKNLSSKVWRCQLNRDQFRSDLKIKKIYSEMYNIDNPKNFCFKFGAGAQFCVSKKLILKNNLSFYKKILNYLNKKCNPIEGHIIERLWFIFFTKYNIDHDIYINNFPPNLMVYE